MKDYLELIDITKEGPRKKIGKLNEVKSAGPDDHHPRVLKGLQDQTLQPLKMTFTKSLDEGYVSEDWQEANVNPILKKGQKLKVANYRPVSLTSFICKVLELLVRDAAINHIYRNDLFSSTAWIPQR